MEIEAVALTPAEQRAWQAHLRTLNPFPDPIELMRLVTTWAPKHRASEKRWFIDALARLASAGVPVKWMQAHPHALASLVASMLLTDETAMIACGEFFAVTAAVWSADEKAAYLQDLLAEQIALFPGFQEVADVADERVW